MLGQHNEEIFAELGASADGTGAAENRRKAKTAVQ
jgi:hypothetical protein